MAEEFTVRRINVGRIVGLSSYELAVKYGFVGTEEEYVKKEQQLFDDMKNLLRQNVGFSTIAVGADRIAAADNNRVLVIETSEDLKASLDPATNTLKIELSDSFKESIVYGADVIIPDSEA